MNKNTPKITVVTVTYNAEKYLKKTIDSIINQNYKNIEYIIIDGGSTDNTLNIINQYNKHISYFISEQDNGIYDAMNKAIDIATGEWINFMNAGDTFVSNQVISQFVNTKINNNIFVACGEVVAVDINNNIIKSVKASIRQSSINEVYANHQCCFTKTSLMKKQHFNKEFNYAADFNFFAEIGLDETNFYPLNFKVANYLVDGTWQKNEIKAYFEINFTVSKHIDNINDIFNNRYYNHLINLDPTKNLKFSNTLHKYVGQVKNIFNAFNNIILYGDGLFTDILLNFIKKEKIIAIADKKYSQDKDDTIVKINPQNINKYKYDVIVILALGRENEIINNLTTNFFIEKNKILILK